MSDIFCNFGSVPRPSRGAQCQKGINTYKYASLYLYLLNKKSSTSGADFSKFIL